MKRRGTILPMVLVITALAAMVAASLLYRMHAEVRASGAGAQGEQAYLAAMSGIQHAVAILKAAPRDATVWYDNPELFESQLVYDDGVNRWYFTIYGPNPSDPESVRYGLIDEAGKINLNTADEEMLAKLPGMTPERVDCLLDCRDRDEETRPDGAEQDYYSMLPYPYVIRNGLLETVEELLLVKGFDAEAVYGEDYNLNGLLDRNEDDGRDTFPPDDGDGRLNPGLLATATVASYEFAVDNDGKPRININGGDEDLAALDGIGLPQQTVDFIRQYRKEGNQFKHPSELLGMRYQSKAAGEQRGGRRRRRREEVPGGGWIESGVGPAQLPVVMDRLTVTPSRKSESGAVMTIATPGLVNVNTAAAPVLAAIPGIEPELARQIADARWQVDAEKKATIAWLRTENLVDDTRFKEIAPRLTARSYQFRIRCVGFGVPCGRFQVVEAILDTASGAPRVVYLRDLTRLGLPMALNVEQQER